MTEVTCDECGATFEVDDDKCKVNEGIDYVLVELIEDEGTGYKPARSYHCGEDVLAEGEV